MDAFSNALLRLEAQSGLSEAAYCKKLGIPRSTYRDWKYGQIPSILGHLISLAEFHSVTLDYLFGKDKKAHQAMRKVLFAMEDYFKYKSKADQIHTETDEKRYILKGEK